MMRCPCGEMFDSHCLEKNVIHVPHITAARVRGAESLLDEMRALRGHSLGLRKPSGLTLARRSSLHVRRGGHALPEMQRR
jgi:hypothetical protein